MIVLTVSAVDQQAICEALYRHVVVPNLGTCGRDSCSEIHSRLAPRSSACSHAGRPTAVGCGWLLAERLQQHRRATTRFGACNDDVLLVLSTVLSTNRLGLVPAITCLLSTLYVNSASQAALTHGSALLCDMVFLLRTYQLPVYY